MAMQFDTGKSSRCDVGIEDRLVDGSRQCPGSVRPLLCGNALLKNNKMLYLPIII